jgi:phosphoribosylpyrophosphate synthetase
MTGGLAIFCGNANRTLAAAVARAAGAPLGDAAVERFRDGEVNVEIRETCATSMSSSFNRRRRPSTTI